MKLKRSLCLLGCGLLAACGGGSGGGEPPVVGEQRPTVDPQRPLVGTQDPAVGQQRPTDGVQRPSGNLQDPVPPGSSVSSAPANTSLGGATSRPPRDNRAGAGGVGGAPGQ